MALYEYRCNDCATTFELLRPMADRALAAVCPACESRTTMPLISRVAAVAGRGEGPEPVAASRPAAGGCCGGGCGCC